jgi:DNA invertase Pin-like site-specific DNA recombinase
MAAQYLRMSTDQQQCSIANQIAAIQAYAEGNNMVVVRTYIDAGRSGLTFNERPGLRQLLSDVEKGQPGYSVVLVYDVSRWGRFQDADESAYYEYRCRRANIGVHYCAEAFPNDGGVTAALVKAIKRAMAGEYSRELSAKVFAGKARLTEMGFRQGGMAGYGIRRLLVDQYGNHRGLLQPGERKSIVTDRVVLIPGPPDEVAIVRKVFEMYASGNYSTVDIAKHLNDGRVPYIGSRPWTRYAVRHMIDNPKYVGTIVMNRRSSKLRTLRCWNPPEMWIKKDNAFEAIVSSATFAKAESLAASRSRPCTDEELLEHLREVLNKHGKITADLIDADPNMPCVQVYLKRFGSLPKAYRKIGYEPGGFSYARTFRELQPLRSSFVERIMTELRNHGVSAFQTAQTRLIHVNQRIFVRALMARCKPLGQSFGWVLRLATPAAPDFTVIARLAADNRTVLDYFCLPHHDLGTCRQLTVRTNTPCEFDGYRHDTLGFLLKLAVLSVRHPVGGAL